MTAGSAPRRSAAGFGVFTLVMLALFIGLGVWQLQRRVEKHALIAALTERLAAAPEALPPPAQWSALSPAADEFRRVHFTATYAPLPDAMVYSSGSAVRGDIAGPGTWAFLPARLPDGETVVINTGFVENTMQDRSQQDRVVSRLVTGTPVMLTGYLRFPEKAGMLTPAENLAKRLWFTRDHLAMARALGWDKDGGAARAVLYRSGSTGAAKRHSQARSARGPSQGRPHAIRHHLVRSGGRGGGRVRGVVAHAAARTKTIVDAFGIGERLPRSSSAAGGHCNAARALRFRSSVSLSTAIIFSPFASSKLVTTTLSCALGRYFNCGSCQSP